MEYCEECGYETPVYVCDWTGWTTCQFCSDAMGGDYDYELPSLTNSPNKHNV